MQFTITLNFEDNTEVNDIEVELPSTVTTVDEVINAAVAKSDTERSEVTSFVIVGIV